MTSIPNAASLFSVETVFEHRSAEDVQTEITVAVSLYNYEEFIANCLDTVAAQRKAALDLIVVDDCSTDGSSRVVQAWMEAHRTRFRRLLLVRHPRNRGLAEARNAAFRLAQTRYVFVLDADNLLYPTCLERMEEVVASGDYGAGYPQIEQFGGKRQLCYSDYWDKRGFRRMNYVDAMALVSVDAWRKVDGYTQMAGWEDYDFWCKFIDAGIEAIFVPQILARYRVHDKSMLRTETRAAADDLAVRMMIRHPWLDIDTS